jgi:hypothetical protein
LPYLLMPQSLLSARLRLAIALLPEGLSADVWRGDSSTYMHLGRKAATIWAS